MTNYFNLLLAAILALGAAQANAQEMLAPPTGDGAGDLPPGMEFSDELPSGSVMEDDAASDGEVIEPMAESVDGESIDGESIGTFGCYGGDPAQLIATNPALFESSGSWLRRGFWYAEADYMLLNRGWDRKGLLFGYEGGTGVAPGVNQIGQPSFGPVLTLNELTIAGARPGADGLARVTLGRFLFRDSRNRDHNIQTTYYGGGEWAQQSSIQASTTAGITVNDFIDRINPSFDGARSMGFNYTTKLDSIESNYLVKARMGRDQMVLQPDGHWVRSAQTSQTYSFLAGVRYLRLTDVLNITAERDPDVPTTEGGFYDVDTTNNLTGGQLGVGIAQETSRWSLGLNLKGGSYWNRMNLDSEFLAGPELIPSRGTTDSTEDTLSFIGEAQLLGKWHLRPNVSLRVGMEMLYVSRVALAPHQVNFVPGGYDPIAGAGDVFCIGSSFGIEAYR